jgi:hypothetical protein
MLTQTVDMRSGDEFSTVTTQEVRAELIRHDKKKVGSVAHDPLLLRRSIDGQIRGAKVNGESMRCNCWIHRLLRRPGGASGLNLLVSIASKNQGSGGVSPPEYLPMRKAARSDL